MTPLSLQPKEIRVLIYSYLDEKSLVCQSGVCKKFFEEIYSSSLAKATSLMNELLIKNNFEIKKFSESFYLNLFLNFSVWKQSKENLIHFVIKQIFYSRKAEDQKFYLDAFPYIFRNKTEVNAFDAKKGYVPLTRVLDELDETTFTKVKILVSTLLNKGADPNLQAFPSTPLMVVMIRKPNCSDAVERTKEIVKLLLKYGAEPDKWAQCELLGFKGTPKTYADKHYTALNICFL